MNLSASRRTWEEASSPAAVRLARKYEEAWHGSNGSEPRPSLQDFLLGEAASDLDGPGARLAVLRADMSLRWEIGDKVTAEWYVERYDALGEDTLVALIYEEFCLREEEQGKPVPEEYLARYPQVAPALRRVLEIHELVGSGTNASAFGLAADPHDPESTRAAFPEAGQTIAGFYLVEELGRGSFARVFLAKERQLADRPVALKVTRRGSREPQTLARLQHTHIVPVHSYRIDSTTGLHLLCMPFFGRMTLARLLADPQIQEADTGTAVATALDRLAPSEVPSSRSSADRTALEQRSYVRAIALWGARLADALHHAHERGVLHRDIKPSNVLVTSDGMPMLLDFNLACDPVVEDTAAAPATLGGTIDYMAPEHLRTLAGGADEQIDHRADIYSLGVVLFEALIGRRPFPAPRKNYAVLDVLIQAAEDRTGAAPRLRKLRPDVPPPLEAVVRHCLEPDPSNRYASAAELAADLQAVADDAPLRHAREPFPSKAAGWFRRRRRSMALAAGILTTIALAATAWISVRFNRSDLAADAQAEYASGIDSLSKDDYATAKIYFDRVDNLLKGRTDAAVWNLLSGRTDVCESIRKFGRKVAGWDNTPDIEELREFAIAKSAVAATKDLAAKDANALIDAGEKLRFRFLHPEKDDLAAATSELEKVLKPFFVLKHPNWTSELSVPMNYLKEPARIELRNEVNELLFLWVMAIDEQLGSQLVPGDKTQAAALKAIIAKALDYCDRSLIWARPTEPWQALKSRLLTRAARLTNGSPAAGVPGTMDLFSIEPSDPAKNDSALGCFQWGLLNLHEGGLYRANDWLKRATQINPGNYWYQCILAYIEDKLGRSYLASNHYSVAIALRPDLPQVRFNRARLYRSQGLLDLAIVDLEIALEKLQDRPEKARVELELGYLYQELGDFKRARAFYDDIIEIAPSTDFASAARLNRAFIDAESGAVEHARLEYDSLIAENPADTSAIYSRALLELRRNTAEAARKCEQYLTAILETRAVLKDRDQILATRALARLELGMAEDAIADATEAYDLAATPAHQRLQQRTLLAAGRFDLLQLDRPDEIALLPLAGPPLTAALEAAVIDLKRQPQPTPELTFRALLNRAVILAALGKRAEAMAAVNLAMKASPYSPRGHLIRARILFFFHDMPNAWRDVEQGIAIDFADQGLLEMRGRLHAAQGKHEDAVADFQRASTRNDGQLHLHLAASLTALGRDDRALAELGTALHFDQELPEAFLRRAQIYVKIRQWDQALVDLEQAAAWARFNPWMEFRIAWTYAFCLAERPNRAYRWCSLTSQAVRDFRGILVSGLQERRRSG